MIFANISQRTLLLSGGVASAAFAGYVVSSRYTAKPQLRTEPITDSNLLPNSIVKVTSPKGKSNYLVGVAPNSRLSPEILHLMAGDCSKLYLSNQSINNPRADLTATKKILAKKTTALTNITKFLNYEDFNVLGYILKAILIQEATTQIRNTYEKENKLRDIPRDLSHKLSQLSIFDVFLLGIFRNMPKDVTQFQLMVEHEALENKDLTVLNIDDLNTLSEVYNATGDMLEMLYKDYKAKDKDKDKAKSNKNKLTTQANENAEERDLYNELMTMYEQYENVPSLLFMFYGLAFGLGRPVLSKEQKETLKVLNDSLNNCTCIDDLVLLTAKYPKVGSYALDFYKQYSKQLFLDIRDELDKGGCMLVLNSNQLYSAYGMMQYLLAEGYTLEVVVPNQLAALENGRKQSPTPANKL